MTIIGLTGTSGSGKNTIAGIFEKFHIAHIDCDVLAREVTRRGHPCLKELSGHFEGILAGDGSLNRRELAKQCFSNKENLSELNRITHRYILEELQQRIAQLEKEGFSYVCVNGAALIESGFTEKCDIMVCIRASEKVRLKRIVERDMLSTEEAKRRIAAQHPDEYYSKGADYIIENNGRQEDLFERAAAVAIQITKQEERV